MILKERQTSQAICVYFNMLKYFRWIEDYRGDFPSDVRVGVGGPIITASNPHYAHWFPS